MSEKNVGCADVLFHKGGIMLTSIGIRKQLHSKQMKFGGLY